MKKRKYVYSSPYIEFEDACLDLFEKMNEEGYILKSIGIFFVFEKSNKKVKYQIDYTPRDTEYTSVIDQLGYVYIGSCNNVHYYYNEDIHELDLNTDEEVKKELLLKQYPFWSIGLIIVFMTLTLMITLSNLPGYITNPIKRYYDFNGFIYSIAALLIGLPTLGYAIYDITKKRKAIMESVFYYQSFKKHQKRSIIITYIIYILLIIITALTTSSFIDFIYASHIIIMSSFLRLFRNKFVEPHSNKNKRILLNILSFVVVFLCISVLTDLKVKQSSQLPQDFPTETFVFHKAENLAVYEIVAITDYTENDRADFDMHTDYTECRSDKISNELLKQFLEINPHKEVASNIVEECYEYLNQPNYYIFKHNTILVRFEERDFSNIDSRISEFISYHNNNKHFD